MRCKNCGGVLFYQDGYYVCESCGRSTNATEYHDATEVYLCCIDMDEAGRRTRDSLLAQEIYESLATHKINAFFGRISASELAGETYVSACETALHSAKTVIVIGTNRACFDSLLKEYGSFFSGKTIIPVFADMDAKEIPPELNAIQALDYGRVGAAADLAKGVLNTLGRSGEVDAVQIAQKAKAGRKTGRMIAVFVILAIVIAGGTFGIVRLLRPAKTAEPTEATSLEEEQNEEKYVQAVSLADEGSVKEALLLFASLPGYKDSDRIKANLYNKYVGYYQDEQTNVTLHFQISDGVTGSVDLTIKNEAGERCRITDASVIDGNEVTMNYTDSANNTGTLTLTMENDSLELLVHTTSTANKGVSFGELSVSFPCENRSDKPIEDTLTLDTLVSLVSKRTTMSELKKKGIEVVFDRNVYRSNEAGLYKIVNTDIELVIHTYKLYEHSVMMNTESLSDPVVGYVCIPPSFFGSPGDSIDISQFQDVFFISNVRISGLDTMIRDSDEVIKNRIVVQEPSSDGGLDGDSLSKSDWIFITGKGPLGEEGMRYTSFIYNMIHPEVEYDYKEYIPAYVEADGGLNLRCGPGQNYDIFLTIPDRHEISISGTNRTKDWYYVFFSDRSDDESYFSIHGWVKAEYVSIVVEDGSFGIGY